MEEIYFKEFAQIKNQAYNSLQHLEKGNIESLRNVLIQFQYFTAQISLLLVQKGLIQLEDFLYNIFVCIKSICVSLINKIQFSQKVMDRFKIGGQFDQKQKKFGGVQIDQIDKKGEFFYTLNQYNTYIYKKYIEQLSEILSKSQYKDIKYSGLQYFLNKLFYQMKLKQISLYDQFDFEIEQSINGKMFQDIYNSHTNNRKTDACSMYLHKIKEIREKIQQLKDNKHHQQNNHQANFNPIKQIQKFYKDIRLKEQLQTIKNLKLQNKKVRSELRQFHQICNKSFDLIEFLTKKSLKFNNEQKSQIKKVVQCLYGSNFKELLPTKDKDISNNFKQLLKMMINFNPIQKQLNQKEKLKKKINSSKQTIQINDQQQTIRFFSKEIIQNIKIYDLKSSQTEQPNILSIATNTQLFFKKQIEVQTQYEEQKLYVNEKHYINSYFKKKSRSSILQKKISLVQKEIKKQQVISEKLNKIDNKNDLIDKKIVQGKLKKVKRVKTSLSTQLFAKPRFSKRVLKKSTVHLSQIKQKQIPKSVQKTMSQLINTNKQQNLFQKSQQKQNPNQSIAKQKTTIFKSSNTKLTNQQYRNSLIQFKKHSQFENENIKNKQFKNLWNHIIRIKKNKMDQIMNALNLTEDEYLKVNLHSKLDEYFRRHQKCQKDYQICSHLKNFYQKINFYPYKGRKRKLTLKVAYISQQNLKER